MKAFIYYNLQSAKWSIKALDGEFKGLVIGHADGVQLKDCIFKVSEKGRQRVIKEQRKNVHAGIEGELTQVLNFIPRKPVKLPTGWKPRGIWCTRVGYNPYMFSTFVVRSDWSKQVHSAQHVVLQDKKVYIK